MSLKEKFMAELFDLASEMNSSADQLKVLDPTFEASCSIKLFKEKIDQETGAVGMPVVFMIIYLSGGGEETTHVLNDSVSFTVFKDKITALTFERFGHREVQSEIILTRKSITMFITQIKKFTEEILPPMPHVF